MTEVVRLQNVIMPTTMVTVSIHFYATVAKSFLQYEHRLGSSCINVQRKQGYCLTKSMVIMIIITRKGKLCF